MDIGSMDIYQTIKKSDGIKSRSSELMSYLKGIEYVKRKLIFNTLFSTKRLPFSSEEKKLITFINKNNKELAELDLFDYSWGKTTING